MSRLPPETLDRLADAISFHPANESGRLFRDALGRFATGVTVVTTQGPAGPAGMTVNSFASVSLDPPLVAFLPTKQSRAFAAIQRTGTFCVNFLAAGQQSISDQLASTGDGDKFADVEFSPSAGTGSPRLAGTVGHVDCTVHAVHDAGDHFLVIGKVVELAVGRDDPPLLYYAGAYRSLS